MNLQPIYKAIKQRLNDLNVPVARYRGQYLTGKQNTSIKVPAIYIELPANARHVDMHNRLQAIPEAEIKVHVIGHAAYAIHDSPAQDAAVAAQEALQQAVDALLNGWHIQDSNSRLLSQQFINTGIEPAKVAQLAEAGVITYTTTLYSYHLRSN